MRHLGFLASLTMMLLAALPIKAQTENEAFYIYQNDGHFDGFFYDEIVKMNFSFLDTLGIEHDEIVSQEIVTADSTYRIMLSAIDSIGFVQPEIKYNPHLYIIGQKPYIPALSDVVSYYDYGEDGEILVFGRSFDNYGLPEPQVGDVFVDFDTKYGYSTKIVSVTRNYPGYEGLRVAICKPIDDITDIFQQFVTIEEYGYDDGGNMVQRRVAGRPDLTIGNFPRKASGNWEGDIFNFSMNGNITLYENDKLNIMLFPSVECKLNLKTAWNLSLLGDKYVGITTKLKYGVGMGFRIDGKIDDFFPSGIGELGSIPVPASSPIFIITCTPDVFLRGEAHVTFTLSSPKLKGCMWNKLEFNNWVPYFDMGFSDPDGSDKPKELGSGSATLSLNGFVQAGMLFPMSVSSLPFLKKFVKLDIGGRWFVGPKLSGDFTVDLTTLPSDPVARYTQLKNITLGLHLCDADFEVTGTMKTGWSDEKKLKLAEGSINILRPIDAKFVPEFEDAVEYKETRLIDGVLTPCRIIAFKPTGFVMNPVTIGVKSVLKNSDGSFDYDNYIGVSYTNTPYYPIEEILGQELDIHRWAEYVIPYKLANGKIASMRGGKFRALPQALVWGSLDATPSYDYELEPGYTVNERDLWMEHDGTVKSPITISGYLDCIDGKDQPFGTKIIPEYLTFEKSSGSDNALFTSIVNKELFLERYKNYNPFETIDATYVAALHVTPDNPRYDGEQYGDTIHVYTHILPNSKTLVLKKLYGPDDIQISNPDFAYEEVNDNGSKYYHCIASYKTEKYDITCSFDIYWIEDRHYQVLNGRMNGSYVERYDGDTPVYKYIDEEFYFKSIDSIRENEYNVFGFSMMDSNVVGSVGLYFAFE